MIHIDQQKVGAYISYPYFLSRPTKISQFQSSKVTGLWSFMPKTNPPYLWEKTSSRNFFILGAASWSPLSLNIASTIFFNNYYILLKSSSNHSRTWTWTFIGEKQALLNFRKKGLPQENGDEIFYSALSTSHKVEERKDRERVSSENGTNPRRLKVEENGKKNQSFLSTSGNYDLSSLIALLSAPDSLS